MYPVKINFKEYPAGNWQDWSEYLAEVPILTKLVESDNPGEAGAIVYDNAQVVFRYEPGSPVHQKFSIDLTTVQKYLFKLLVLAPDSNYTTKFVGVADFSTIRWNEHENLISFEIVDKLSALALLSAEQSRDRFSLKNRVIDASPVSTGFEFRYHNNSPNFIYISAFHPYVYDDLQTEVVQVGEIIDIPEIVGLQSRKRVITRSYLTENPNTGKVANYVEFLPYLEETKFDVIQYEDPEWDMVIGYQKNFYNIDINNVDGNSLVSLDGFKIIEALYKQAWADSNVVIIPPSINYSVPSEYAIRLIDDNPFGKTPLDALITMINSLKPETGELSGAYVYVDNTGHLVIQSRQYITAGQQRVISSTKIIDKNRKYFWDKLADGASVVLKTWVTDAKTGNYIEAKATATLRPPYATGFIKPKNEIKKELISLDLPEENEDPIQFYQQKALECAEDILNFYGKRREAIKLTLNLDSNTINWEPLDYITMSGEDYFFSKLIIDLVSRTVELEAVQVTGTNYDIRLVVHPMSESNYYNPTTGGSNISYIGGGTSTANYNYMAPLEVIGGQVLLNFTDNLKITINKLDTVQDITTTSTPTFAQLTLTNPGSSTAQAVRADRQIAASYPLTGGGDLTANRTIGLSYNATNLKLTSNALNTIQDIGTSSSPLFSDLTLSGKVNLTAGTSNVNSVAWGTELYLFRSGPNELRLTGGALRIFRSTNPALILGDNGSGSSIMNITAIQGQLADIRFQTSNSQRWIIRRTGDAESGNNSGSNFHLNRYNDSGVLIDTVLSVSRNTGNVGIGSNLYAANEKLEVAGNIHVSGGDRTIYNRSNNYLALGTNNVERIRILSNGNVAIGTSGAPERLTIAGNTHLAGHIFCFGDEVNSFWGNVEHVGNKAFYNDFTSGWTGSGWRLGYDLDAEQERVSYANLELDNLWVRGTMTVYELIINQIRATNGSLFVTSSARVESTSSDTSYNIRIFFEDPEGHNLCPFLVDDILLMQRVRLDSTTLVKRVALRVMSVSGRSIEANYVGFTPLEPPQKGELYVRIGNYTNSSRRGSIYLTSDDSNAPYMDVIDEVAQWSDWGNSNKLKVRIGRLSGINDSFFGNLSGYGLYAKSNAYLRGKIYAEQGGWIAGWTINAADLSAPAVTVAGKNNLFKLNANQSTSLIGAHLLLDTSAIDVPGYLSFGRVLSGTGTPENKIGIAYKQGSSTFFELTDSDKSIAGWNFNNNKLYKDSVAFESSASMKGLTVDTDKIKIGSFTFGEMSNPLTDITYILLNGYTGISASDISWSIIGNYWDMYNKIEDVGKEQYNNLIRCVIGTAASSWDYRLTHYLAQADMKVLGKQIKVEFKIEFTSYPDYMEDGGLYQVAIRYYDEFWNTIYRRVILEGTVNNGLTTQTIDKTGANGIIVMVPTSIPNIQYVYIEWGFYGGAQSGTFYPKTMELSNVKFYGYEGYKCWLNETGLYLYNSPNNHIKMFADYGEINIPLLKVRGKRLVRFHGRLSVPPVSDVELGDMYISTDNNKIYQCNDINNLGVPQWSLLN